MAVMARSRRREAWDSRMKYINMPFTELMMLAR